MAREKLRVKRQMKADGDRAAVMRRAFVRGYRATGPSYAKPRYQVERSKLDARTFIRARRKGRRGTRLPATGQSPSRQSLHKGKGCVVADEKLRVPQPCSQCSDRLN